MKFRVSDEVESSNSKKKFCLLSIMMSGVVSGLDVNQCPASNDLSKDDFGVEQLNTVIKVKMKLVQVIAGFIIVSLCVNCQTFDFVFFYETGIVKRHCLQRPRLCEGLEFEIRPPGGNAD